MKSIAAILFSVLTLAPAVARGQQAETLSSVKQKYLNQRVVITGYETQAFSGKKQPVLMEWHPAKEHGDGFRYDITGNIPVSYKGQTATVVAISLNTGPGAKPVQRVNALGEAVSPDQTLNPYFDLIVKFDDGKFALTTGYPNTITLQLQLASVHDSDTQDMAANLPAIVGKTLYAAGYSHLYLPDSTLMEMRGPSSILKQLPITAVHPLDPLQVTAAKYIDTEKVVILKLRLPNGSDALTLALGDTMPNLTGAFLDKLAISSGLLSSLPTGLSAEELDAVKKRIVMRGMSTTALRLALGFPKKENDWGKGGKQLIFSEGFLVYVNDDDKVADWQILNTE